MNGASGNAPAVAAAPTPAREAEKTFLQERGVTVTSTRFIVPNQTYAMAGITSVRFERVEPKRGWPIAFILTGLLFAVVSADSRGFGILLLVIGVIWIALLKTKYAVALRSASGEVRAVQETDSNFINGIVAAVNEAIVYRR
jgi:hypothetical protein